MKKLLFFFLIFNVVVTIAMDEQERAVGFVGHDYAGTPEFYSDDYLVYVNSTQMIQLLRESSKYKKGCEEWVKDVNTQRGLHGPSEDEFNLCRAFAQLRGDGTVRVHEFYRVRGGYVRVTLKEPKPITCTHKIEEFEQVEEVRSAGVAEFIAHARELQRRMDP